MNGDDNGVKVWDLPVRLFHWSLVTCVLMLFLTGEIGGLDFSMPFTGMLVGNMDLHMTLGSVVLALLIFRVLWGLVGSSTARFIHFVRGPSDVLDYLRALLRGELPRHVGHNPAGALMVLALLGVLFLQVGTGLFSNDDIFSEGPLAHLVGKDVSDLMTELHKASFSLLLLCVSLHISAALYYRIRGEDLVTPMITGRKHSADIPADSPLPAFVGSVWAAALFAFSCFIVWGVILRL
ncbi:hypothetical protein HEQ63_06205 [Haematospirillum jordaniae]|uniref:cytochrome b/b6 domain-containing protein n=1 Tax=Haematospirillum jordaniae TaxID=1549855 RepID=UPI001432AF9E|nr:cytochrome b/b6 domain-containing protein [Haematospirillum jordaniae]NKD85772.1 hypothetical protein [Haematospirillum jordaniae]